MLACDFGNLVDRDRGDGLKAFQPFPPERFRGSEILLAQPIDVVAVGTRFSETNGAAHLQRAIGLEDILQNQRKRTSIEDGMVKCPHQLPIARAEPDQRQSPERDGIQIEAATSIRVEKALETCPPLIPIRVRPVGLCPGQRDVA